MSKSEPAPSNFWHLSDKDFLRVQSFLRTPNFDGFSKQDLFIKNFIKKGWGQDIAALSNMAEAIANIVRSNPLVKGCCVPLLEEIINRALHQSVSPYRLPLERVKNLGPFGYYLEHLNIILGHYQLVAGEKFVELGSRISQHLRDESLSQDNYHARLLPHVRMRWSADQAAINYSLWLYDQANGTNLSEEISEAWLNYMFDYQKDPSTGLFVTEVMGAKSYSRQPRGCSSAYMVYYMSFFAPTVAADQWILFKAHMRTDMFFASAFREYVKGTKGAWTPDSGPILAGIGVAATGLSLKTAAAMGDKDLYQRLNRLAEPVTVMCRLLNRLPILKVVGALGSDLLSSSIRLAAASKNRISI